MIGQTLAHYRIERHLGEGGMGVVYAARDLQLDREVALKVIRADLLDPSRRERFWREARAAAAMNHPNIGHLYEIREESGQLFITMELLEGESLAERLTRGPLPCAEAVRIGLELLDALAALHGRGFVHRDVKPSNVFLLPDERVKLLDFGLVFPVGADPAHPALTMSGTVMGSPRYMAPEQIRCGALDGRTDLFALAAVLHEAVTGRPTFGGSAAVETMYSVLHDPAPPLGGSAELDRLGRVLHRALAKDPEQRFADAGAMKSELAAVRAGASGMPAVADQKPVRLAVLPFRMLRPDPELEFLGPSLADAVAMTLAGIRSLVVRPTMATSRFAGASPDLHAMADALEVDVALAGTILAVGGRCRVAAQLLEAPGGRMLWSQTLDEAGDDVFQIQDTLARRIVDSLQLPLTAHERSALGRDVPATPEAYEYFLRANRYAMAGRDFTVARDLYQRALEADPAYAPAWARLGRCFRILGKYFTVGREDNYRRAAEALAKAFELRLDLPIAHHYQAQIELDLGNTDLALERMIGLVERNPNDPDGFAGLVSALRYVSMLEESLAAHWRARELDPEIPTSVHYTLESMGDIETALAQRPDTLGPIYGRLLAHAGRREEALQQLREAEAREQGNLAGSIATLLRGAIEGDRAIVRTAMAELDGFPDPEGILLHGSAAALAGEREWALRMIEKAVDRGYWNVTLIRSDSWLDPLREEPRFVAALARAEERHQAAVTRYRGRIPAIQPGPRSGGRSADGAAARARS
jgi:eukaryotic-like serine/threonine-protein kinase